MGRCVRGDDRPECPRSVGNERRPQAIVIVRAGRTRRPGQRPERPVDAAQDAVDARERPEAERSVAAVRLEDRVQTAHRDTREVDGSQPVGLGPRLLEDEPAPARTKRRILAVDRPGCLATDPQAPRLPEPGPQLDAGRGAGVQQDQGILRPLLGDANDGVGKPVVQPEGVGEPVRVRFPVGDAEVLAPSELQVHRADAPLRPRRSPRSVRQRSTTRSSPVASLSASGRCAWRWQPWTSSAMQATTRASRGFDRATINLDMGTAVAFPAQPEGKSRCAR